MKTRLSLSVMVAFVLMVVSALAAQALKPTVRIADLKPKLALEVLIPKAFGDWRELPSMTPVLPDPTVQATLNALYSQTIARSYISSKGQVVMLTIAYGSDQSSEATAAHRPEFCYNSNGFKVQDSGTRTIALATHGLTVRQLIARKDNYVEPISYWVTLDESATLPGMGRKLAQIRYGLRGLIADGMLMRLSSPTANESAAFAAQSQFARDLEAAMPTSFRARFFGV